MMIGLTKQHQLMAFSLERDLIDGVNLHLLAIITLICYGDDARRIDRSISRSCSHWCC
jgi:hypothetical protein